MIARLLHFRALRPVDLLIIAAYLASILAIGAWCRRRQKTTRHYFLAGRHLPWWAIAGSIVATETSAITFVSIPGVAFSRGGNFTFLQLVFGYLVGRVVICLVFIPAYFRRSLLTIYEVLNQRFGGAVKSLAASLFIVMRTIADAVRLLLTSLVMAAVWKTFVPSIGIFAATAFSIVLIGAVMLVFTAMGGMEAVVWTEVLHVGVYIIGAVAAAVLLANAIPGGFRGAIDVGAAAGKFRIFDFSHDFTRPYVFWSGVIGGCFLNMSTHGTDQYMVQRYLCTTSARKASIALLFSGLVILVQFAGFLFIGVLLFAYYRPDHLVSYTAGVAAAPFHTSDQVFPDFIINHVPAGLCGLIVAAVLAAATSPSTNSIAATAVKDLYEPLVSGREDHHYLRVSRVLTVIAGLAQISVALLLNGTTRSAVDTALSVASLINGPILGVFLLAATKRGGSAAAIGGMLAGMSAVAAVWLGTKVAWPWYAVVGSMTTLGVGLLIAMVRPAVRSSLAIKEV
jgi:SSS family transporter